jgi:hypothetical protein
MTCRPRIQHFQGPRGFLLLAALGACMADRSVDPTADEKRPEFRRRLSLAAAWDAAWEVVCMTAWTCMKRSGVPSLHSSDAWAVITGPSA